MAVSVTIKLRSAMRDPVFHRPIAISPIRQAWTITFRRDPRTSEALASRISRNSDAPALTSVCMLTRSVRNSPGSR